MIELNKYIWGDKMEKGNKRLFIYFYCVSAIMLIIAAFWDLEITRAIYFPENFFGEFLDRFGELPTFLVVPLAGTVLFCTRPRDTKKKDIIFGIFFSLVTLLGWVVFMIWFGSHWFVSLYKTPFSIVLGAYLTFISLLIGNLIPLSTMKKLRPLALAGLLVLLLTTISVEAIKNLWGRVRFRSMVSDGDFYEFTKWFIPNGIGKGKSLPSGHTSASSLIFTLCFLSDGFEKYKKYFTHFFIFSWLYTFAVGFSRMTVGAHYLSDITIGATIGLTFFILVRKHFLTKKLGEKI